MRRSVSAIVLVSLLLAAQARAADPAAPEPPQPAATPRFQQALTPGGAAWRSAVLPGWGQRYKGETTKGWILTGTAAAAGAATAGGYVWMTQSRAAYLRLGNNDSASAYESHARDQTNGALAFQVAASATALTWLYGLVDSSFAPIEPLRIRDVKLNDVFPAGAKFFESNPLAVVSVENRSSGELSHLKVRLDSPELFGAPIESEEAGKLAGGASRGFALEAAFGDRIYTAARGDEREIPAVLTVEYESGARKRKLTRSASIRLFGRNAIVWDDMRRMGAFVTPRDPGVLALVSAAVRRPAKPLSPVGTVATAAALFDAMGAMQIVYQADPTTPFADVSGNVTGVDTVNFPRETLTRKTGDCDDLSTLYSALLEGAGVKAALVDVPGHVFVMFDTGETAEELVAETGFDANVAVTRGGTAWLPVEVTAVGKTFDAAIASASSEVAKWQALKKLNVFEVDAAQTSFPPAPPRFAELEPGFPALDSSRWAALEQEDAKLSTERASASSAQAIAKIRARKLAPASEANELGVLYAKLGRLDDALAEFQRAGTLDPKFAKAQNNLGNIFYARGEDEKALTAYTKALDLGGENPRVLANLALLHYERGETTRAAQYFERAVRVEPLYTEEYPDLAALITPKSGDAVASRPAPSVESRGAATGLGRATRGRWMP